MRATSVAEKWRVIPQLTPPFHLVADRTLSGLHDHIKKQSKHAFFCTLYVSCGALPVA